MTSPRRRFSIEAAGLNPEPRMIFDQFKAERRIRPDLESEQGKIFIWFESGSGNLIVRARAGTGKTTTIIEGAQRAPEDWILLAAFNKAIQKNWNLASRPPTWSQDPPWPRFSFLPSQLAGGTGGGAWRARAAAGHEGVRCQGSGGGDQAGGPGPHQGQGDPLRQGHAGCHHGDDGGFHLMPDDEMESDGCSPHGWLRWRTRP